MFATLSSFVSIVPVAPEVEHVRFDDKMFAGLPSSRCKLMIGLPASD